MPTELAYVISGLLGMAMATGASALHSHHAHADDTMSILFAHLPNLQSKIKAGFHATSLLLGHAAQGFFSANAFLDIIKCKRQAAVLAELKTP
jgi:hypothetical protein